MKKREFLKLMGLSALPLIFPAIKLNANNNMKKNEIEKLTLSEDEWRQRLTPEQFYVLRNEGTERAFTSPLNDEKREGVFVCAGCQLPLFDSATKYDSGTGWPSFFDAKENHLGFKRDFKLFLPRKEYHCARCGGHQGHIFDDGPEPTGLRYCNNGIALQFIEKKQNVQF